MIGSQKLLRQLASVAALSFLIVGTTACSDDEPDEPEIAQLRLTIGTTSHTSVGGGNPTPAVVLARGNNTITVTALTATGQVINLSSVDFELRIQPANAALVTFTRSSPFAGTLNGLAAGQTTLTVELFHLGEGHPDYQIENMPVTVQ